MNHENMKALKVKLFSCFQTFVMVIFNSTLDQPSQKNAMAEQVLGVECSKFIFFHVKENEPKENARKTLLSCASRSVRRTVKLATLKQSQLFYPHTAAMLGAS